MFDNLRFVQYRISYPISKNFIENILSNKTAELHAEDFSHADKTAIRMFLSRDQYLDYYYSSGGNISSLYLPPVASSVRQTLFSLLSFSLFSHTAPSYTSKAQSEGYTFLHVYKGCGYLKYKKRKYYLEKGDGFFIDNRFAHEYGCTDLDWEYALIEFAGPQLKDIYQKYESEGSPVFSQSLHGNFFQNVEKLLHICQSVSLYKDWKAHALITNLLVELIVTPHKEKQQSEDNYSNIQYLIIYMEANYKQDLSLEKLCQFSGFSRSALSVEFKKYTGTSPNNYLIMLRLQKAKELLETTRMPCIDIAYEVGFRDINNFINLFKKYIGSTPNAYRRNFLPLY